MRVGEKEREAKKRKKIFEGRGRGGGGESKKEKASAAQREARFYRQRFNSPFLSLISTNLSSIFWIFERSSIAASERSDEEAGAEVGGEAEARRRRDEHRRR